MKQKYQSLRCSREVPQSVDSSISKVVTPKKDSVKLSYKVKLLLNHYHILDGPELACEPNEVQEKPREHLRDINFAKEPRK